MAVVQVELCSLERFPSHLSLLDVLILKSKLNSILQHDSVTPTVLFIPQQPQVCNRTGILLRVHPITEVDVPSFCGGRNSPNGESDRRLRVFVSKYFHRHHRLERLESTGTIRPLEPVNLDRVVLGARSRQSLRWAGAEQFTSGLLELCLSGEVVLARQGTALLLPQHQLFGEDQRQVQQQLVDLLVLECSPVTQGRITANTSLVLTDSWDSAEPTPLLYPCRSLSLCVSDFAHYADGLVRAQSLLDTWRLLGPRLLDLQQVLECRLDVRVVDTQLWHGVKGQQEAAVDVDNCVFVSKQQLLRLGLFNHEWVTLSWPGGSSTTPMRELDVKACISRERLVSVVVVDLTLSPELQIHNDVGFVSATLWFNMTEGEMIPMKRCTLRMKRWKPSLEHDCHRSDSFCCSSSPAFASKLHIQLIVSPLYNNLGCYDNLLAEHFSTPRVVSQGDILTVPAEHHPDLLEKSSEGISRCPVLYFRVQKVCSSAPEKNKGRAYLVDRTHTSLYLGASTNSPVPFSVEEGSLWSSLSPPGLNKTVDLISSIILPHLQHRSLLSSCTVLLHGPAGSGKTTVVRAANRRLNLHLLKVDCVTMCADTPAASEAKLMSVFQRADTLQPCILLLRNLQLLLRARGTPEDNGRVQAVLCQLLSSVPARVVVVATVCRAQDLSAGIVGGFVHQVALESPTEEQRLSMLVSLSQELHLGRDVNLERLSKLTAGFVLGDLNVLLVEAGRSAWRRLIHTFGGRRQEDLCFSGVTILNQDFTCALETLQDNHSKAIGAPKIPKVCWEDVGGLENIKKEILDTVQLPLQRPELLSLSLNRTGVLLYGPPGTGKTLLAKAVATECSMTFLSVKGPELINMYVGQSEENIREVFHRARSAAPCVVFFDELDSLAPNRGRSGDSGGVMDRVVSQLLAELDTLHLSAGVFVIGATNRPDLLDQSLLRPGRFDKLVYVGINEDRVSQLQVLQAILRKFQLDPAVKLQDIVNHCPGHMTGADLYALCSDAMTVAIKRKICLINKDLVQLPLQRPELRGSLRQQWMWNHDRRLHTAAGQAVAPRNCLDSEDSPVLLSIEDFSAALENFKPSVSDKELLRYQNICQRLSAK